MAFAKSGIGRTVNDLERELFSLPARFAGLGIANPCTQSEKQFKNSEELSTASRIDPGKIAS